MPFHRSHRSLFDRSALDYDAARPGYPEALIAAIAARSGAAEGGRILEIGCGTGQLTRLLAARGYRITAIEIGEELGKLAESNLERFPDVNVIHADFEKWDVEPGAYDVVASAQAFHWIAPNIGYPKAYEALQPNGSLALVWNLFPGSDAPVYQALADVYRTCAPQLGQAAGRHWFGDRIERTVQGIAASGLFEEPDVVRIPWATRYTTSRYLQLLRTFSDHAALHPDTLERLLDGVRLTIDRFGGTIDRRQVAVLFLARRRSPVAPWRTE
jgi:SAM-dependent methyltransferase